MPFKVKLRVELTSKILKKQKYKNIVLCIYKRTIERQGRICKKDPLQNHYLKKRIIKKGIN